MNYDEKLFKEKANRKARKIWLIFAILLSANYGSDFSHGLYSAGYYLTFLALCWIPFIAGEILLRVRGWDTTRYKFDLVASIHLVVAGISGDRYRRFALPEGCGGLWD